jgi:hypothetical protein
MVKLSTVISQWGQLFENFQASSQEFYKAFEAAVASRSIPQIESARVEHKEGGLASANREYLRLQRGKYAFDVCAAPFGNGFFVSWWFSEPPLRFGFLYMLAFIFALFIVIDLAYLIGFAIGVGISGFAAGVFFSGCAVVLGVPLLLWILGNAVRKGSIGGESTLLAIPLVGRIYERVFAPPTYYSLDTGMMFQQAVHNAVLEVVDCMTANKGVRALTETERKPIMKRFTASA